MFDPTVKFVIVGWNHLGSHESSSSIAETTIEVDGYLKVTPESGWRDTCDKRRTGAKRAICTTDFYYSLPRTIRGESDHFFSTPGYPNSYFETSDQA